jgi:hypothetical protein
MLPQEKQCRAQHFDLIPQIMKTKLHLLGISFSPLKLLHWFEDTVSFL